MGLLPVFRCGGAIPKPANSDIEPLLAAIAKRAQAIRSLSGEIARNLEERTARSTQANARGRSQSYALK